MQEKYRHGDFTLPGEAGYEQLTLKLAEKWGADVIRDSDGTKLSDEIVSAGYRIYSTICIIRQHNEFAEKHLDSQQQSFLCSEPVTAEGETLVIRPLEGYFTEQFEINESADSLRYWQVYDRTENTPVPAEDWSYSNGAVTVKNCKKWHNYTVSFLCYRIWEEINMYNHTTNNWTSAHLRQLDPRHPAAWEYLQKWLDDWCVANPDTNVVRLTSLFYNFVWIFGDDMRNRSRFVDWASYDFTVSPAALDAFKAEYGYSLTAEDFINQGKLQVTHMPPTKAKKDYMDFIQRFVAEKAKVLVDIIHKHGKQAYVFYDDSWVGMEPYGKYFETVGFDGLIKCVFSGYECALCSGAKVPTHEIRLHPYLFPVGLGGLPTFSEGGDPSKDARAYWKRVRRAILRRKIDRIGLGGYLHLTENFPDFCDTIEQFGIEFRRIKEMHEAGAPYTLPCKVAVLHTWGSLRSWTLSGHFHETYMHNLIHINEALAGLPVEVKYVSFEDVENGALDDCGLVINAGCAGDAWSGGDAWKSAKLIEKLTEFVHNGGTFVGVNEPSAVAGYDTFFRMAHVLGVDLDTGARVCHGKWEVKAEDMPEIRVCEKSLSEKTKLYLTNGRAKVLCAKDGMPVMTVNDFGKGHGVYMSGFALSEDSTAMLMDIILYACGLDKNSLYISDNANIECAFFPESGTLVAINQSESKAEANVNTGSGKITVSLEAGELRFIELK